MKPILIIKTGNIEQDLRGRHGDKEDMFLQAADIERENAKIVSVYKGEQLPEPDQVCGAIITGSAAMVTDREPWSVSTEAWVRNAAERGLPILGVCYGHQLLAQAFGGEVIFHPLGMELGTVSISLNENGINDKLLGVLPHTFMGQVIHSQTVKTLPPGAINLASNAFEKNHAFRIGKTIWGVQFHPEFSAAFMRDFIKIEGERLEITPEELNNIRNALNENEFGFMVLQQFVNLVFENTQS
jgi:GMP synthase (glutamine-hydrolysing)